MGVTARAIGILGGTFDPVHVGHLAVGQVALVVLDLERVLFMPAGQPPHKRHQPITDAVHREAMLRLAIAGSPGFALSRLELERAGPSYAVDTIAQVAADGATDGRPDPWFILSSEAMQGFPDWHEPERILEIGRLAVTPRPGTDPPARAWIEAHFPGRSGRVATLPGPHLDVSATLIRQRVAAGLAIDGLVPAAVEAYIMEHHLYAADPLGPRGIQQGAAIDR
jgi:nicotinate-nucleotide adenylyltransferase